MMEFKIEGLQELADELKKVNQLYPDESKKMMRTSVNNFKKDAALTYASKVKSSEELTKGFHVKVTQSLENINAYFYGENKKNRHFHLVENGHDNIIPYFKNTKKRIRNERGGEYIGFVAGLKLMPLIRNKYTPQYIANVEALLDQITRGL